MLVCASDPADAGPVWRRWSVSSFDTSSLIRILRRALQVRDPSARVEHEASTSKIGEDQLFYFQQRGIDAEEAVGMIISGFCSEVQDEGLALDRVLDLNCVMDSVCWRNDAVDGVSALRRLRQVH